MRRKKQQFKIGDLIEVIKSKDSSFYFNGNYVKENEVYTITDIYQTELRFKNKNNTTVYILDRYCKIAENQLFHNQLEEIIK